MSNHLRENDYLLQIAFTIEALKQKRKKTMPGTLARIVIEILLFLWQKFYKITRGQSNDMS